MKNWCSILLLTLGLLVFSVFAHAASGRIPWHLYLIGMGIISTIIAIIITSRKKNLENMGIRILVWGVYFWIVTFIQLILLSLIYVLV